MYTLQSNNHTLKLFFNQYKKTETEVVSRRAWEVLSIILEMPYAHWVDGNC